MIINYLQGAFDKCIFTDSGIYLTLSNSSTLYDAWWHRRDKDMVAKWKIKEKSVSDLWFTYQGAEIMTTETLST